MREGKDDGGSPLWGAFYPDSPAVGLDNSLGDAQSQAKASDGGGRDVGPIKFFKNPLRLLFGHSDPLIGDGDPNLVGDGLSFYQDRAASGRIFDGIGQQIVENL